MDFFNNPNYRLNRFMLSCFGQWPLQSPIERYFMRTTSLLIIISIFIPKIIKFAESLGNANDMIDCLPVLGIHIRSIFRFINLTVNAEKMRMLTNQIEESWNVRSANFEGIILRRYAERGKLLTVVYTANLGSALLTYLSMPLIPIIMDVFIPLNDTRQRNYPYQTEYFLEEGEKYFFVLAHAWISMPFSLGMIIAYDAMFAVNVHHGCSIFAMLGCVVVLGSPIYKPLSTSFTMELPLRARLENVGKSSDTSKLKTWDNSGNGKDEIYEDIVCCIKIHKEAVEIASLLESSGYMCYLFVVGVSMMVTTLTGFMAVTNLDKPGEALRHASFAMAEVVHMFYLCWQGHVLVQHSENIFINAYNVNWYDISPRAKKLLILIMLRSAEPCKLTAGKIFVLSMENFAAALKTSMSYFTVLLSMQ